MLKPLDTVAVYVVVLHVLAGNGQVGTAATTDQRHLVRVVRGQTSTLDGSEIRHAET